MPDDPAELTANQLVAYNLMRVRKALGWSQEEAAERLAPYMGAKWSKTVYSTTERSYHGKRIRQFTADDLVAFSLAFGVPVPYFLTPPRPEDRAAGAVMVSGATKLSWRQVLFAANGFQFGPAILMRMRELPAEDQPPRHFRPQDDPLIERYGLVPGSEVWHEVIDGRADEPST